MSSNGRSLTIIPHYYALLVMQRQNAFVSVNVEMIKDELADTCYISTKLWDYTSQSQKTKQALTSPMGIVSKLRE